MAQVTEESRMNFVWPHSLLWIEVGDGRSDLAGGMARTGAVGYFHPGLKHSVRVALHTPVCFIELQ